MSNISPVSQNENIAESLCKTTVEKTKCSFLWIIDQYSVLTESKFDLKSSEFSAVGDDFKWHLEHRIEDYRRNYSDSVTIYLNPDFDDLRRCGAVAVNVEVSVMRADHTKINTNKTSSQLDWGRNKKQCFVCCVGYLYEARKWAHEDKLNIMCELSYFKKPDIVNLPSSCGSKPVKISESSISTDYERFFIDDSYFKDVTISVKGKNYLVHKAILAARSSVFNAMLRNHMEESQKNHIVISDIDGEIFEEMLHYIYTGKTKNLEELAFELLPVADKYDLKELRTMCEEVLIRNLSTDNVARILILADMHHAEDLKAHTLRFVKLNNAKCKEFKKTEIWNIVTTSRPHLMKDMLNIFLDQ